MTAQTTTDEQLAAQIERENAALEAARERFFTAASGKKPDLEQLAAVNTLQALVVGLAAQIELLVPGGRNKSLALTALEDVQMRANRGIFAQGSSR